MIDVKELQEWAARCQGHCMMEISPDRILALCDRLEAMEREREDQNRYLAAQSAEIAGLKQRLAKQPNYCDIHCKKFCQNSVHGMCDGPPEQQQSVEVMEKKILELADKYRIDYGGDYSRNAKEHEFDLLAFVRAVLPASTQQLSGLSEFLRNHAIYHESGIAAKAPEVVEHVKKLRAWADALDGMPQTVEQQTSGEVTHGNTTMDECMASLLDRLEVAEVYADRYRYLRERPLDAVSSGGVFAGKTPDNVVLNGAELDAAIDAARTQGGES
ncbi:hypothetical protein X986_3893 [Burkholderia pseudomallei]|uniref:hypothetical protein n=1 Tax=Burkholderia pseudomallei TaxID=28450 RepID=UPI0005373A95|nr:hypothetical protein [Burkholderia pseudomallei]KGX12120.1 hypothetical protein X984_3593 [Burkholderia pseudomallei]KGX26650.1 hypothetical protein X986_3893 [Burkholderia pseudomallei]